MKQLLLAVLLGLGVLAGGTSGDAVLVAAQEAQQDPAKLTVYITKTGEKYHADGCQHLRRSKIPVSLKEAVSRGYGPCSVCKPARMTR